MWGFGCRVGKLADGGTTQEKRPSQVGRVKFANSFSSLLPQPPRKIPGKHQERRRRRRRRYRATSGKSHDCSTCFETWFLRA